MWDNRLGRRGKIHRRGRVYTTRRREGLCGARAEGRGMLLRLWVRGIIRIRLSTVKLLWTVVWRTSWTMVGRLLWRETVFWTVTVG